MNRKRLAFCALLAILPPPPSAPFLGTAKADWHRGGFQPFAAGRSEFGPPGEWGGQGLVPTHASIHQEGAMLHESGPPPDVYPGGGPIHAAPCDGNCHSGPPPHLPDCHGWNCHEPGPCHNWYEHSPQCCDPCCYPPGPAGYWCWWRNLSLEVGVHGFKGPVDFGMNGNFGFDEAVNYALPLGSCLGLQAGVRGVHSNFSGSVPGIFNDDEDDTRNQVFITAGFFRRCCHGWRWGAVWDYLHDDYYVSGGLNQVRAEVSHVWCCGWEVGAWAAVSGDDESFDFFDEEQEEDGLTWEPTEQIAFFLRRQFCNGASMRGWGGFTSQGDGLVGVQGHVPLCRCLALAVGFNYLIPSGEDNDDAGEITENARASEEAWNVGFRLVWYPGGIQNPCGCAGSFRPLFDVADNGWFLVDRYTP